MSLPRDTDEPEATTYFQIEQRRAANPGEEKVSSDISTLPPQPPGSPWAASIDEICGVEPTVDRSAEDADHFVPTPTGDENGQE